MATLYALCIMIFAIVGIGVIVVLPNAPSSASQSSAPDHIDKSPFFGGKGIWENHINPGTADIICSGEKCWGTDRNDVMRGHDGKNQIHGFGGNDIMYGGNLDDWMVGYAGDDIMYGRDGLDKIRGEQGSDTIYAENGNDEIWGRDGNDMIYGNDGNDDLIGGIGADRLEGGNGNDVIWHGNTGFYEDARLYSISSNIASDGSRDIIYCGEGYDKVFYNQADGDRVASDCEEKYAGNPTPPPASNTIPPRGNEDCDRAGMPGCP